MKFNYTNRDILKPGVLSNLCDNVFDGLPVSSFERLTTDEMHRIPEIYARLDYSPTDLIECTSLLDILEDDKIYKTYNNKEVFGADIKSFTLMMYLKPRTAYWKPTKPQVHDTSVCGAVPLPLLGFKRFRNIPYSEWQKVYTEDEFRADVFWEDDADLFNFELHLDTDSGWNEPGNVYPGDLLLGHTLSSTRYNEKSGEFEWSKGLGLIMCGWFPPVFRPDALDIRTFRTYNVGNYSSSYATTYGTSKIPVDTDDGERALRAILHNDATTPLRLMLSQRWAWYGKHRNTDMICDFQDWDNIPKDVDSMSISFGGHEPKIGDNIKTRFGIMR